MGGERPAWVQSKIEVTQFLHGLYKQIRVRVGLCKLDKRCISYFDTHSET